jgi:tRNA pseudouridine13 synthase
MSVIRSVTRLANVQSLGGFDRPYPTPMKLKCRPEDFRVEELPLTKASERGRYTFYCLTKRDIGTIEAIDAICRRWNLAGGCVSYAGLKDRHAWTTQFLTIAGGPSRLLKAREFELEPVGTLSRPYGPDQIRGNRFVLVLRDMSAGELGRAGVELAALDREGLPNYFDDQRFGSVGFSGQFIAHAWLLGDYERALKLALAEANPFDRKGVKAQKALLRDLWGRWAEAKARLERSSTRSIVTYLVDHPTDHRGAFARMRRELRRLYFSAFQSHLWNAILGRLIDRVARPEQRVPIELKTGTLPFHRGLEPEQIETLTQTAIPLPCARTDPPAGLLGESVAQVLAPFQLTWPELKIRHLKDVFFSKGSRASVVFPQNLRHATRDDELHPRRLALELSFELARGSYATILVKRITDVAEAPS